MLTADQRKELEALEAEMRERGVINPEHLCSFYATSWADRIAAVLANGREEG